ncbi:MAG: DUF1289 domain-containing protein [Betaproteobacteria bacterium]|nr:DUF1289 domain-containing protein [Betaproteobacteria bacterium]
MNALPGKIASPCIGVCTLDAAGRACLGCCRTADEIAVWVAMTPQERAEVIGQLPERRRRIDAVATPLEPRSCAQCGIAFGCGANGPEGACWCGYYPVVTPKLGATCLCPACLAAAAT